MTQASIKGFNLVKNNLAREVEKLKTKSMKGLITAAAFIRNDMEKTPPLIPVDTGNLRASWFTSTFFRDGNPLLIMGFNANYALWVHENVDADFTSTRIRYRNGKKKKYKPRPGAGAKFLEACLNRNHDEILRIIAGETKIF